MGHYLQEHAKMMGANEAAYRTWDDACDHLASREEVFSEGFEAGAQYGFRELVDRAEKAWQRGAPYKDAGYVAKLILKDLFPLKPELWRSAEPALQDNRG